MVYARDPASVDTRTRWLGLELTSPLVLGASPLTDDLDALEAAVEAGAGAIVMRSLFEEELSFTELDAEAPSVPLRQATAGAEPYLALLRRLKQRLPVPVIASLNGTSFGSWLDAARMLADAGADAIELNLYDVVTDLALTSAEVETRQVALVAEVARRVPVPLSVKLLPFYTALPALAWRFADVGARGLVLFNRFFQAEVDTQHLDLRDSVELSSASDLSLRLFGLSLLSGRVPLDLAATGGIQSGRDAMKAVLSGAHVLQMTSAILRHGPSTFAKVLAELRTELAEVGYGSVEEARGAMGLEHCLFPRSWERVHYLRMLRGWPRRQM